MSLPSEPAVEESALASVVSRILEMSPEELYDLSVDERQVLWRSLDGNCTRVREAQSLLRLKHRVDFEEDKILELFTYPLYSNLYDPEEQPEQAKKYEDKVVSMLDRCRMLFSRYKKYFSSTDIDAFENAFRQSREQKCIYEGDIDSANKLLLTSIAWKHNPNLSGIVDEICRGMIQTSFLEQQQSDWPAFFFSDYCLGKIDFNTFQSRLSAHVTEKKANLHDMRDNMERATLSVSHILESGMPYEEDANEDDSPYDGTPYDIILQEHNQLLRYEAILALDEPTLNAQLEPLIYLYRGESV